MWLWDRSGRNHLAWECRKFQGLSFKSTICFRNYKARLPGLSWLFDYHPLLDSEFMLKLTMDSELFAVKKFFEIGSDDSVTPNKNAEFLKCKLIQLKTAMWFLKKFKAVAKEMKVDIATSKFHHIALRLIWILTAFRYHTFQRVSCLWGWDSLRSIWTESIGRRLISSLACWAALNQDRFKI